MSDETKRKNVAVFCSDHLFWDRGVRACSEEGADFDERRGTLTFPDRVEHHVRSREDLSGRRWDSWKVVGPLRNRDWDVLDVAKRLIAGEPT